MWDPGCEDHWFSPCAKTTIHPVIPPNSHCWALLSASIVLSIWASWTLPALVLMRAVLRDWILSIRWHGRLRIRQLWFPSRLQGWICARASVLFIIISLALFFSLVSLFKNFLKKKKKRISFVPPCRPLPEIPVTSSTEAPWWRNLESLV